MSMRGLGRVGAGIASMIVVALAIAACSGGDRPASALEHFERGVIFQSEGLHREALAEFDAAIRLDPR